jgi:cytochrome d ubiquinol oxidase subunit I
MDDVVLLSRIQFALTIMFHYLFPPLTIGMGVVLVYLEGMYLKTKLPIYETAAKFWTKIFALNFAIGVATGIVMEFEFGTNWAVYSEFVGDVFGSALAAEGIFAFFLESGFLAVLVFGWNKVGPKFHFFATCMVALGSIFSSVWITVANSWQQTPAGHHIAPIMRPVIGEDGRYVFNDAGERVLEEWVVNGEVMMRAEILDFWQMVFNPSTIHRLTHVWIGCFIMGAFFIMSISAYYLLRGRHLDFAKRSFVGALIFGTIFTLAAPVSGHFQARNVYEHQPAKMAAFEGHFETGTGDLSLVGWPDAEKQEMAWNLAMPGMLSFLIHDDFETPVVGLDQFAPEDQPPLLISFWSYHIMVGMGMLMILMCLAACFFWWRGTLFDHRWLLVLFVIGVVPAVAANQLGWVGAEVGRQPWIVHPPVEWADYEGARLVTGTDGVVEYDEESGLRTTDAVSTAINSQQVLGSIIGFGLVYGMLGLVWLFVLNHKIHEGPEPVEPAEETTGRGWFEAASGRIRHEGTMTESKQEAEGDEATERRSEEGDQR